jgi:hypothetical protein
MVFMKSWDSITAEYDSESIKFKSALSLLKEKVKSDNEFRFYILRVNSLYKNRRMDKLDIDNEEFLEIIKQTLKRKAENVQNDFSVLKDPVSNKLPDDYELLCERDFF